MDIEYFIVKSYPAYKYDTQLGKFVERPNISWCQIAQRSLKVKGRVTKPDFIVGWMFLAVNASKALFCLLDPPKMNYSQVLITDKHGDYVLDDRGVPDFTLVNYDSYERNAYVDNSLLNSVDVSTENDEVIKYLTHDTWVGLLAYDDIKKAKPSYEQLLKTNEWLKFRQEVFFAHNYKCQHCGLKETVKEHGAPFTWEYRVNKSRKTLDRLKRDWIDYLKNTTNELWPIAKLSDTTDEQTNFDYPVPIIAEKEVILNAHHEFYVKDNLPWHYPIEAMTTLCQECHKKVHAK